MSTGSEYRQEAVLNPEFLPQYRSVFQGQIQGEVLEGS